MKKHLLIVAATFICGIGFGQLKLITASDPITDINGTTVEVNMPASTHDMTFSAWVVNNGSASVSLKCRRTEIDVLPGTTNGTCWEICPPFENAGDRPIYVANIIGLGEIIQTINPNDTNRTFVAHYTPENLNGCSLMLFEWFEDDAPEIALASLYIRFIHNGTNFCTASIKENEQITAKVFPVPTSNTLSIEFENNTTLKNPLSYEIISVLGETIATNTFKSSGNFHQIETAQLKNGVYFIRIKHNQSTISTKKFIVNH